MMNISVIVSTYNRPDALSMVLDSVRDQECGEISYEIIIADDGSGLPTQELIRRYQKNSKIPLEHAWQEDRGFRAASARNLAVRHSKGRLLIFLDGDCVAPPDFCRRHWQFAELGRFGSANRIMLKEKLTKQVLTCQLPINRWGFADWAKARLAGGVARIFPLLRLPDSPWRNLFPRRWRGSKTCNLSVWRDDFFKVNGFDERFNGWGYEDSDLVIRLIRSGVFHKNLRFGVPVFHLWHQLNDRSRHEVNRALLDATLSGSHIQAVLGIR